MSKLRPRERELVKLLMSGTTRKEAASVMGIGHGTAKTYANRAMKRLAYRTVEQMMFELGKSEMMLGYMGHGA